MKESERPSAKQISQPRVCLCKYASRLSHGFLFGLFTTASCTSSIEFKAHSVFAIFLARIIRAGR